MGKLVADPAPKPSRGTKDSKTYPIPNVVAHLVSKIGNIGMPLSSRLNIFVAFEMMGVEGDFLAIWGNSGDVFIVINRRMVVTHSQTIPSLFRWPWQIPRTAENFVNLGRSCSRYSHRLCRC